MLNKWISDFGGQRGRIFPGMSAFFDFVKQRAESKVLRIQLQNNRNFQLDPHIKIQKKKNTRFMRCFFRIFQFLFLCVCRNVTGQWPWIPLFPVIPLSTPLSLAPATVFYFICSFCWWRHYCFCDTLDGWRKAIFSLIIYIFYIEKLWLVSVLFYCVFCLIYFVACHGDTTMSN